MADSDRQGSTFWLAWSLWVVTVAFGLIGFAMGLAFDLAPVALGSLAVGEAAVAGLGVVVVVRRPTILSGWLLISLGLSTAVGAAGWVFVWNLTQEATSYPLLLKCVLIGAEIIWSTVFASLLLLIVTAPDGRFISERWRWSVAAAITVFVASWGAGAALNAFINEDLSGYLGSQGTLDTAGITDSRLLDAFNLVTGVMLGILVALSAASLVHRYRSTRGEERQQVKWVLAGCGLALLFQLGDAKYIPTEPWQTLQSTFAMASYLSLTAGFGFALLKYRLWDIDVVLRRSLVYGTLWLSIAAAYAGSALLLGLAISARVPVWLAITLTVVASLAFQPARRRLESLADRWVFGRREPPIKAVHSFGESLGAAEHIEDIASQLAGAAMTAARLEWVRVQVEDTPAVTLGSARPRGNLSIELLHGREALGCLEYGPATGHELNDEEQATLAALCTQASTAISHARLAARIVKAQESERRRIERNIHDGAQQELVALVAKLGLARSQNGSLDHAAFLAELQQEIRSVLGSLRELAQGVHPSVLRDGGLAAAIEDRCSRLSLPVELRMDPAVRLRRLQEDIEAAAYFVVAESLTNILRHSSATSAAVEISVTGTTLLVQVSDNGAGFDTAGLARPGGLQGLADRLQALGGSLVVDSSPGAGTSVRARLPIRAMTPA